MASMSAKGNGMAALSMKASMTEVNATIGPTLTSISPEIMMKVAPQAAIPTVAASRKMLS